MSEVVIVSGVRTAVGTFGGSLVDVSAVKIGSLVVKEALRRAGLRPKAGDCSLSTISFFFVGSERQTVSSRRSITGILMRWQ